MARPHSGHAGQKGLAVSAAHRPAAPWIAQQTRSLLRQQGHAWLLHGPSGLGQYELALSLAQAWLCESPSEQGACGTCPGCHAISVRTHADLCVLMPETSMLALEWPLSEKAQAEIDDKKRKPSREIRIEAMREAIEFAQRTSARGRGKVVLVFPAEQMNTVTANALLKTLEEPVGHVRFVLASESSHQLLPTIRSRCLGHTMVWPDAAEALQWLQETGLPEAEAGALLRAAGGRPQQAAAFHDAGQKGADWARFPEAMARAELSYVKDWSAPVLVDALHKLCHDAIALHTGAASRFFPAESLKAVSRTSLADLLDWSKALRDVRRTMDHPFNPGLMQEALVDQARTALNSKR
jgi:DNA polymerase III subunit delta'